MIEALYYTNKAPQVLMPRWMCQSYIKLLAIANTCTCTHRYHNVLNFAEMQAIL